ncbi:energy transducer TonB [Cupriavidus necator]|uniref:energy transducer TonB n=1 Tax=Cupriavidus necator TaxID=106590 RepID=UPI00339DA3B0
MRRYYRMGLRATKAALSVRSRYSLTRGEASIPEAQRAGAQPAFSWGDESFWARTISIVCALLCTLLFAGCATSIDEAVEPPKCTKPSPFYPSQARRLGQQGTVTARLQIDVKGHVERIEIVNSSGFARLDTDAINAWKQKRCQPARDRRTGEPVAVTIDDKLIFQLK